MKTRRKAGVFVAIEMAARAQRALTAGTLLCVAASIAASLAPLLLARVIDTLTGGAPLAFAAALHQLRGAAFFPRARDASGANHAGRPWDYPADGEAGGGACRH